MEKRQTRAHGVGVNDEQTGTEMQPGRHRSNTQGCFKMRYLKRQQKPFLFKETSEPCGVWSLPQLVLSYIEQLTLPRRDIFQVIIKSELLLFFFIKHSKAPLISEASSGGKNGEAKRETERKRERGR